MPDLLWQIVEEGNKRLTDVGMLPVLMFFKDGKANNRPCPLGGHMSETGSEAVCVHRGWATVYIHGLVSRLC